MICALSESLPPEGAPLFLTRGAARLNPERRNDSCRSYVRPVESLNVVVCSLMKNGGRCTTSL